MEWLPWKNATDQPELNRKYGAWLFRNNRKEKLAEYQYWKRPLIIYGIIEPLNHISKSDTSK